MWSQPWLTRKSAMGWANLPFHSCWVNGYPVHCQGPAHVTALGATICIIDTTGCDCLMWKQKILWAGTSVDYGLEGHQLHNTQNGPRFV